MPTRTRFALGSGCGSVGSGHSGFYGAGVGSEKMFVRNEGLDLDQNSKSRVTSKPLSTQNLEPLPPKPPSPKASEP